jgi:hypothetical protein
MMSSTPVGHVIASYTPNGGGELNDSTPPPTHASADEQHAVRPLTPPTNIGSLIQQQQQQQQTHIGSISPMTAAAYLKVQTYN